MGKTRKLEMKVRDDKQARMVTFSKRRKGLFKKTAELHRLTGASTAVLTFSPAAGTPFVHGDPSFEETVRRYFLSLGQEEEQTQEEDVRTWLDGMSVDDGNYDMDQLLSFKNMLEELGCFEVLTSNSIKRYLKWLLWILAMWHQNKGNLELMALKAMYMTFGYYCL